VRPAVLFAVVAVVGAGAAACTSGPTQFNFPPPRPSVPTTSTTVIDYGTIALADVAGRTTTTIDNSPGKAHLGGTVVAPEGAVPGATVRVERLVGDSGVQTDVATNPDGTWKLDNIKGGRYRVRAWRAPDLALVTPQVFFLNGDETRSLQLQVNHYGGTNVSAAIAPSPPPTDDPSNLVVQVTTAVVDADGVVRATPLVGAQVTLQSGGSWLVQSSPSEFTDAAGQAYWQLICQAAGNQLLYALVGPQSYPLNIPPCAESSATTSTTSLPGRTTSTR
jgi:hypothetical protein